MHRYFSLEDGVLSMQTQLDTEFGPVILWTYANLHLPEIVQRCIQDQTEAISLDFRIHEMYHFLSILKLFDPEVNSIPNSPHDGLSQIVSQTQTWSQNQP